MVAPRTGAEERTIAEEQTQYSPVVAAVYAMALEGGRTAEMLLTRWRLDDEARARIAAGEDVYIALMTFGRPMQPMVVQVGPDGWVLDRRCRECGALFPEGPGTCPRCESSNVENHDPE